MPTTGKNRLYYGDNLTILRDQIPDESVDLIYLDPPFNSNRNYNVLFKSKTGQDASAQIEAFDDTWTWSQDSEHLYIELVTGGAPPVVADALVAMRRLLGANDMLAYLVMMSARLVQLHRVLKPTGSMYLHCDPTASHYLKILLDAIFGPERFLNELVWKRAHTVKGNAGQGSAFWAPNTDSILFYAKGPTHYFEPAFTPYTDDYLTKQYRHTDERGRYRLISMIGPGGAAKGNPSYEVMGVTRYWRYSRKKMDELISDGMVVQTNPGTVPQRKQYLEDGKGVAVQSLWEDIGGLQFSAAEKLGYPTQKPVALLERIISASCDPDGVVLDPFCGCGTTVDAAQKLGRKWVGIDITYLAIDLIDKRLRHAHGDAVAATYETVGTPRDVDGARALFDSNPFDFERWAVSLLGAQPNQRQVGDRGIDGIGRFPIDNQDGTETVLVSVKGGKQLNPGMVRDLIGTVQGHRAGMGVFVCLSEPTPGMKSAARQSGLYVHPLSGTSYPKVQIITVADLLAGKKPNTPTLDRPYIQARRHAPNQPSLFA
jgi:DNA modification methylase